MWATARAQNKSCNATEFGQKIYTYQKGVFKYKFQPKIDW